MQGKSEEKTKNKNIHLVRGMKDILPSDQPFWQWIGEMVDQLALAYGYKKIDTPVLEESSLFVRSVGKETDIVEKEMFTFVDQSGDSLSLRPEGTAPIVRAYIEHGMVNQPQPIKLYYWGPFFRHDRPQAGRYRQFYQFGFEVIGDAHPIIDAQLILLAFTIYKELGVEVTIQVNSLGCLSCREEYKKILIDYYKSRKNALCENCKKRFLKNPLRLLDCKEVDCRELTQEAPQIVDHLCEECRSHFVRVLEYLDELEITYALNPRIVRGLDYYTRTTFEIWTTGEEDGQQALGGGGRYDSLIEQLGGRPTPAAGFASGIERLIIKMRDRSIAPKEDKKPEIFIAQLGDLARKKCLKLFEEIRKSGILVAESFSKDGIKPQLEIADKLGTKIALILGQKEIMDETIIFRDMENGIQETVDFKKTIPEIKKRLERINKQNFSNNLPK